MAKDGSRQPLDAFIRYWVTTIAQPPLIEGCADLLHFYEDVTKLVTGDDPEWLPIVEAIRDLCTEA